MHSTILSLLVVLVPVAGAAYYVFLYGKERRVRAQLESDLMVIKRNAKALRQEIQDIRDASRVTPERVRHVGLKPYNGGEPEYIKALGQIATRPEVLWFLWTTEQRAVASCKNASDDNEKIRAVHWLEMLELIERDLANYARQYDVMTQPVVENESQISLS